jgi:hypothetical protein
VPVATDITHSKESDGNAVTVRLSATVVANQPAVAQGWLGITVGAGESGEYVALSLEGEYQFKVPASLEVSNGDIVRIDITDLTGNTPDDTAYNKDAASSTNVDFFKATRDKNASDVVTGILLLGG